jgi:hypothetical protein
MFTQKQSGPLGVLAVQPRGFWSMAHWSNAASQVRVAHHGREQLQRAFIDR